MPIFVFTHITLKIYCDLFIYMWERDGLRRPGEALHPLRLEFKVFVSCIGGCWGQSSDLHTRAAVPLTAELSLQPDMSHLLRCYSLIENYSEFWGSQHTFEHLKVE